jgi:hypothetical protein
VKHDCHISFTKTLSCILQLLQTVIGSGKCNAYYDDGQCAAAGGGDNGASCRPLVGIAFGVLKDPK